MPFIDEKIVGVDIGSSQLKVVLASGGRILNYAVQPIPEGLVKAGRIKSVPVMRDVLRHCFKRSGIKQRECIITLSADEIILREMQMPDMDDSSIIMNVQHELAQYLPVDVNNYMVDYLVLEKIQAQQDKGELLRLLVVAAPIELINGYLDSFKEAGLKVRAVDILVNSYGKLVRMAKEKQLISGVCCIVDIGANYLRTMIFNNGEYSLQRSIAGGGNTFNGLIANSANIEPELAESYKRRMDIFTGNNSYSQALNEECEKISEDIRRVIQYYRTVNGEVDIQAIYICGGTSLLMGLGDFISKELNIKVLTLQDIIGGLQNLGRSISKEESAVIMGAYGATLREDEKK